jgi:DNA-binding transcriptional LysR family regulator
MHLSLRQLEVFRLFSKTRNVTETASLLRVTQPSVSQTLKEMENQVGFTLFIRVGGRMHLTPEATALLTEVERVLAQFSTLRGRASELRDGRSGKLSIASVSTLYTDILPSAMASFRKDHDKVHLRADTYTAAEVVQQVRQDHADVGFAFLPVDEMGVAVQPLLRMQVLCAMPDGHELARQKSVSARDLNEQEVIIQNADTPPGMVLHESLDRDSGFTARVLDTNHSIPALHMVRHGLGVALVHPLTLSLAVLEDYAITALPLAPPIYQTLGMVYSRHRPVPRSVVRFEKYLRRSLQHFCEQMNGRGFHCEMLI